MRQLAVVALLASGVPLLIALSTSPASASSPSVVCASSGTTLTVTVSGQSTSADALGIAAAGGDYEIYLGSVSDLVCTGPTYTQAADPTVDVESSGTSSQYVIIDDTDGALASATVGCPSSFSIDLNTPTTGTNTIEAIEDSSPAPGDAVTAVEAATSGATTTDTLDLAAFSGCDGLTDVTVPATTTPPAIDVVGQGGTLDEVDLEGDTSVIGPINVNMEADTTASPGTVTGEGTPISFSGISIVLAPSVDTTFEPGTVSGVELVAQPAQINTVSLAGETGSATGLEVNATDETYPALGSLTGTSSAGTSLDDTFSGVEDFDGSPNGTTFVAPSAGGLDLDGSGTGNTLDLTAAPSGGEVTVNGDSVGSPGVVSALTAGFAGLTTDSFYDVQTFIGSASGATTFVAPSTGGLDFEGKGTGNSLDLSAAPKGALITANGNSVGSPGVVSGLTDGFGVTTDSFSGIQSITGSLPPSEPTDAVATPSEAGASVSFTAPAFDGGSAITGYEVTATDVTHSESGGETGSGTSSPVTVSGLTPGDEYTFTVTASNTNGPGPASAASSEITAPSTQVVRFTSPSPGQARLGSARYTPTATASSGLPVTITLDASSTGCSLSGGHVSFVALGTCVLDANQAGNGVYDAATQVQQSIDVLKGASKITITSTRPSKVAVDGARYRPTATSTSHDAVTVSLNAHSSGCTLNGGVVAFVGVGTCELDFTDPGNASYLSAVAHQNLGISKGTVTVRASASPASSSKSTSITLKATLSNTAATGSILFTAGANGLCSAAVHSGVATCKISRSLATGSYTVAADYNGNANFNAATGTTTIKIT